MKVAKKSILWIIKSLWFAACVIVLVNLFTDSNNFENKEAVVVFALSMIALTYPSGYIVWALFSFKARIVPGAIISPEIDMVIRWFVFLSIGYFQWFYLFPKLLQLLKKVFNWRHFRDGV
jgi:hypothetical protein